MKKLLVSLAVALAATIPAASIGQFPNTAKASPPVVSYTYDAAGRLASVTNAAGTVNYSYDTAGNLISVTRLGSGGLQAPTAARGARVAAGKPRIDGVSVATAAGSTVLTLSGGNFESKTVLNQVRVGGAEARVLTATPTRITVAVPFGAKGNAVTLTTPHGAAATTGGPVLSSVAQAARASVASAGIAAAAPVTPLQAPAGQTALSGVIEQTDSTPLAGVSVSVQGHNTKTDSQGRFLLKGLKAGHGVLWIDATKPTGGINHGQYEEGVAIAAKKTSVVPWTIWLPKLDLAHALTIASPTTAPITYTSPLMPGLQVKIPKGTVIHDHYGHVVHQISLTQTPLDRTPLPLSPGMPFFYTLQPSDSQINAPGIQILYPNITHASPGTKMQFDDNNPDKLGMGWYAYGIGTVSKDGSQILPAYDLRLTYIHPYSVSPNPLCTILGFICAFFGSGSSKGDPVNLATGLFINSHTDLGLPDVLPISATRVYRQGDLELRAFGNGQSSSYDMFVSPDSQGNYVIQMPDSSSVVFAPTGTQYMYASTAFLGGFAGAMMQEISDNTFVVNLTDGTQYNFGYYHPALTGITDRYGNTTTITRVGTGQAASEIQQVTSPNGRWLSFTYGTCVTGTNSQLCVTQVTDNIGRTVSYGYDGQGRLTSVTDPAGNATTYGWATCTGSNAGCTQITSITDPRHITYLQVQYDTNGRVSLQTQADSSTYTFAYTLSGSRVTETDVTDPNHVVGKTTFDSSGYPSGATAASGTSVQQTVTYTHDVTTHLLVDSVDALNRDTHYTYDAFGDVLTVTALYGTSNATTISFAYELKMHRLSSMTDPLGHSGQLTYYDNGNLGSMTASDQAGSQSITTMQNGQATSIADPLGNTTYLSYLSGDLVGIADPAGNVTTRYFDGAGRLLQSTDPNGNTTTYQVDAVNQLTAFTDALGNTTSLAHDANGNLTSLTDPKGNATSYVLDNLDRVQTATDSLNQVTQYQYDSLSNLTQVTTATSTVNTFVYDALNRPTSTRYGVSGASQQSTVTYGFDAGNRLTSAVDSASGTFTQGYDGLDHLTSQAGPNGSVAYTYDTAGRRATMTVQGQSVVNYGYDARGVLTSVTQGSQSVGLAYDASERRTSVTLPDGIIEAYSYDPASRVTGITYTQGSNSLGNLVYTYDANGQRTSMDGSLATSTLPPVSLAASQYNADNQLTSFNGTSLSYDANGNLTNDGANSYAWNARGQLTGISGGQTASFAYDPFGRRQTATVGSSTGYLYDGSNVVQELSGTTPVANELNGLGMNQLFSRTDAGGTASLVTDALGSTIGLGNAAGSIATQYNYTPHGAVTQSGAASANSFQFAGQQNDGTGLNYDRARYYSPSLGRFISQDPLGFAGGGSNLYQYAANDPVTLTDPSGAQLLAGCAINAGINVLTDWLHDVFNHRKTNWSHVIEDAVIGCAEGFIAVGLGEISGAAADILATDTAAVDRAAVDSAASADGAAADSSTLRDASAACGGESFSANSQVVLADGTTVAISRLRPGDKVLATDPTTGKTHAETVEKLWVNRDVDLMNVVVHTSNGRGTINSTAHHLFWDLTSRKWTEADKLKVGDHLWTPDGRLAEVAQVVSVPGSRIMWDLTVTSDHDFYVTVAFAAVLVHNCAAPNGSQTVQDVLNTKQAGITRVQLPPGSPGWDAIRSMTMDEIRQGAQQNLPGYKRIWKLLNSNRWMK